MLTNAHDGQLQSEKAKALRCRRYESIVNEGYDVFDICASLPNGDEADSELARLCTHGAQKAKGTK